MKPLERVLAKLPDAKRNGHGWTVQCPAHDDRRPSLSIAEGDDGRALVKCHAGCDTPAVVASLGLSLSDLMPDTPTHQRARGKPRSRTHGQAFTTPDDAVATLTGRKGPPAARWTYRDAHGEPMGVVIRWDTPEGKDVRPVSRNGRGWIIGGMSEPRPLYLLPELLSRPDERVYVCEGEKAADAAASVGLLATTSPHGSKSAGKADWSPLAGRDVVILPDYDDAGERYADEVAAILAKLNPPATVRVVRLPDLPERGDMVDWLDGRECIEPDELRAAVERLADEADRWTPAKQEPPADVFKLFPVEALPEPVASFVSKAAEAIGCDPSYLALPLLAALASAIGNTRRIELKPGWTEPAIVWTAIVGDSGTMKSPAMELALKPLRERQRKAMGDHAEADKQYRDAKLNYERGLAVWKRGKDDAPPPTEPEEPTADRCWCDDATVEALAALLLNQWRGLLMVRDELAGWLGGFDRYASGKGGDVAKWLEMFGGRSMVVDRKTGNPRTLYVPRAAVSIAGGIQPATLSRSLGVQHRENGLAARLLLTMPPRKPKRWTEAGISARDEQPLADVFERLYRLHPDTNPDGEPEPVVVRLTEAGKRAWVAFYEQHSGEQAELTGDLSAAWSKLEGYAARLALVVHFVRWAAGDPTLADVDRVDEVSIDAGVKLSRWFGHEARRVYAMLDETDEQREARELVDWIQAQGATVSVRDLTHGRRQYRGKTDEARAALDRLEKAGYGQWRHPAPGSQGGRPSPRFELVTGVTVTETPQDIPANAGIGSGDSGDRQGQGRARYE